MRAKQCLRAQRAVARRRTATLAKCQSGAKVRQSHRHAGKVSKWCNSATLLAHPFEHLMDHVPTQQCCTNAVGRSPTSALISQCLRRTRAVGCRRTTTLAKCAKWCKSATLLAHPFEHLHGPRAHPTVLHQCGRKVANQCVHIPAVSDACCGVQAHRHAGKVSKWYKSATLLAHPFEHLTDHVPTQQCCTNAVGRSPTSAGTTECLRARVLWRAGAPPRWQSVKVVQKCDIACTTFRAPHGPRAHSTVLHQWGRKVANQCGHRSQC